MPADEWMKWVLLGIPVVFGLGWWASRWDLRQWRQARAEPDRLQALTQGLNLLLRDQKDEAIDAFIVALQADPNTIDLHFTLGELFRKRGEYERAIRLHEHLLARADLPQSLRDRAQLALATDFMRAGLLDHAERHFQGLMGTEQEREARLALLQMHERARDWPQATAMALRLEAMGLGSLACSRANHACEQAVAALKNGHIDAAKQHLQNALRVQPGGARATGLQAQWQRDQGQHSEAVETLLALKILHPAGFVLHSGALVEAALASQNPVLIERVQAALRSAYDDQACLTLLEAWARLDPDPDRVRSRLLQHVQSQQSVAAAHSLLQHTDWQLPPPAREPVQKVLQRPLSAYRRYTCAACGFASSQHFWQCPGCLNWDSYPPYYAEEL